MGGLLWLVLLGVAGAQSEPDYLEHSGRMKNYSPSRGMLAAEGQVAWERGELPEALVAWSEARSLARAEGDQAAEVDLGLRCLAVLRRMGRITEAREQALLLDAPAQALGPVPTNRLELARSQLDLAAGSPRAEARAQAAFEAFQDLEAPSDAANAAVVVGLARLQDGRPGDALRAFEGAEGLFRAMEDPAGLADALVNAGVARRRLGDLGGARSDLVEAVDQARAAARPEARLDATINLWRVLVDLGRIDQAGVVLDGALAQAQARKDLERQAVIWSNRASLHLRLGQLGQAKEAAALAAEAWTRLGRGEEALSVRQAVALAAGDRPALQALLDEARRGDRPLAQASLSLNLAVLTRSGDPKGAAALARRALALAEGAEQGEVRWRSKALLGLLELDQGRPGPAEGYLQAAVDELELTRQRLDWDTAQDFVLGHEEVYEALIDVRLLQGDTAGAFAVAQSLQAASLPEGPQSTEPGVVALQRLRQRSWALEASLQQSRTQAVDSDQQALVRAELAQLRVDFAHAVDELRAGHADLDALVRIDPEDLEAVQHELDPGVLVVQPIALPDRLVLLVVGRDTLVVREAPVGRVELGEAIESLGLMMSHPELFGTAEIDAQSERIGAWVLDPIQAELEASTMVVVSPSGMFRRLPLGLLRRDGHYLIETHAVGQVAHVGSLRRPASGSAGLQLKGSELLLVGNPDGSLPGAETEVRAISRSLPGTTALIGAAATRPALLEHGRGKEALHLATHGVIDLGAPELSYLVLAPSEGEAGRLSYGEIPGLGAWLDELRLVVLSACETARPITRGDRQDRVVSVDGLAAQFRRAGVETLVASLWRIDDDATLALMEAFYADMGAGIDPVRAMQRAQLELLSHSETANPYYWGGFVVVGDWR